MSNYDNHYYVDERALYEKIRAEMIRIATHRELWTYLGAGTEMGIKQSGNHMQKEVGRLAGEISRHEYEEGRPLLSVLIVNISDWTVSEGFWGIVEDEILHRKLTDKERYAFWNAEIRKVWDFWAGKVP